MMRRGRGRLNRLCGLWLALAVSGVAGGVEKQDAGPVDALAGLRTEQARHFFSADAHLALAKGLLERGDGIRAFFVSENARRSLFEAEEFAKAHRKVFRKPDPFDNRPEAEEQLQEKVQIQVRTHRQRDLPHRS